MDAVASRLGSDVEDGVADAFRARPEDPVRGHQPDRHGVDERVARVLGGEADLAAQVRHAEAVAVPRDSRDHALEKVSRLGIVRRREPQRVQDGNGPRAHGEDVAQDAAHAGGGALEGLDKRGVVVALDLEGQREPASQVHDTGVLAGALQHLRALGGELTQEDARVLVGTVLGPERGEKAQLGEARLATEPANDAVVLLGGEAVAEGELLRDLRLGAGHPLGPGHPVPTSPRLRPTA